MNFFRNEVEKTGSRRKHRFFLSKKKTAKTDIVQKNVVFEMTGRYVKRENKGQNKDNQIKENLQKRDTFKKKDNKKGETRKNRYSRKRENENVQKQRRINTKETFFCQRQRGRTNMQKQTYKIVQMSNNFFKHIF